MFIISTSIYTIAKGFDKSAAEPAALAAVVCNLIGLISIFGFSVSFILYPGIAL